MKVSTMRWVDRWIGTGICAGLSLVRRLGSLLRKPDDSPPRKILFVKLAEQGSTVLAYPALHRAVEMVGRENVYFLVFRENRFILDVMEIVPEENVVTIDAGGLFRAAFSSLGAVHRLRKLRVDAAVDLEFFARSSAIFTYLSGAHKRVGFHSYGGEGHGRGTLMTHPLVYNPHYHTAQIFLSMVESLAQPRARLPALAVHSPPLADLPLGSFSPSAEEVEKTAALIRELTGRDEVPPLVLLNANCSDLLPIRKWDPENYVVLGKRLIGKYPAVHVAFTGAPAEAPLAEELIGRIGSDRCVSLAGKTTLRSLLVAYHLADLLVTNDSGPAHFASLTPIDVITLFGPETPELFSPPSPRSHVMWSAIACSPCVNAYNNRLSRCHDNLCMQLITVDQVFAKACEVLESRRGVEALS